MSLLRTKRRYTTLGLPSTFAGITRTAKRNQISNKKAAEHLSHINTYIVHRPYRKPKYRNPFYCYIPMEYFLIDLIDLAYLGRHNSGYKYILSGVDCFSRKAYAVPLKTKKGIEVAQAFEKEIIPHTLRKIRTVISDRGSEFISRFFKQMLNRNNIKNYYTNSELKASLCEIFNRTLQKFIFHYMTHRKTKKYVDKLEWFLHSYNNTKHSYFENQLTPNEAMQESNSIKALSYHEKQYSSLLGKGKRLKKFKLGDKVRIRKWNTSFSKGYRPQWSDEVFFVSRINERMPVTMYGLTSTGNANFANLDEDIEGFFYSNELTLDNTT